MTREELKLVLEELEQQGFKPYINRHDSEAAEEEPCSCGGKRFGIGRKRESEYICWAICPHCGEVEEF